MGHIYVADRLNSRMQKFLDQAAVPDDVPAVTPWGLIVLTVLMAVGLLAALKFRRRRPAAS
jgi:hypothetical protein